MRTLAKIIMTKQTVILGLLLIIAQTAVSQNGISVHGISPGDTLRLFTQYADCGEWGGHHEHLKVFLANELVLEYTKDTVSCENDDPDSLRRLLIRKSRPVRETSC
jgi:hypothetical protein